MLAPGPLADVGGGRLDRLHRAAAALGCSPAEALALAVLVAAALATLGLLYVLAGRGGSPDPGVAIEPLDSEVVVHVSGEVAAPGMYRLPGSARVADALEAAGGVLPGVPSGGLNLARPLTDGEQIVVAPPPDPATHNQHGDASPAPSAWRADGRLDLNLATAADLEQLPGVGPVTAQRIIQHREQLGRFAAVGDLRGVTGIGEKRLQALVDLVDV